MRHVGIRKIEAALLDYSFERNDIVVAHPEHLGKLVEPETRILGDEYGYDLTTMIRDVKSGRTKAAPLRTRLAYQPLKLV